MNQTDTPAKVASNAVLGAGAEALKSIDYFEWHEAMDRASLFAQVVDDHLLQLRAVQSDAKIKAKVEAATTALCAAYQMLGARRFDLTPNSDGVKI